MIIGMSFPTFTLVHVVISLVAILAGLMAARSFHPGKAAALSPE